MDALDVPLINPYKDKFSAIILFGPPGAGKGTLGRFLGSAGTQFPLSTGDIFRSLATYSPAGKLYYHYASKGQLLPDEAMIEIWKYYVQGLIATNRYYPESQDLLLEGIPRTLAQAKMLEPYIDLRHIIVLEVSNTEEMTLRLQKRSREEGNINAIDINVFKKRLESYERQMQELLTYYPHHLISRVNAEQGSLEVLRDVLVRLSHLLSHKSKRPKA